MSSCSLGVFFGINTLTSQVHACARPCGVHPLRPLLVCPVPSIIMKLFAIASIFALSSILVSGSAIHLHRRGSPGICGEGSELLNQTSVAHAGKTILVSISTCPPTKRDTTASKRSSIDIDKRQNICTNSKCDVTCRDVNPTGPALADCRALIKYIASYAPGSLTLGAGKLYDWSSGTCTIAVANYDTVSYSICYETIAYDAGVAGDTCLATTTAGFCLSSGRSGDDYGIAIG
ncbi:hypothetical protein BC826DRAFT_725633 [Russula brevipes]|nr:hypothetical protein BC826DRAFT_725633 [Russula brevipes]